MGIKVHKTQKGGNIPYFKEGGKSLKKSMLRHGRAIAIISHIHANKLESRRAEETFLQREGQILIHANLQLTFEVCKESIKSLSPAEDIINDNAGIITSINSDATRARKVVLSGIHIMDEDDKDGRAINGAKRHHSICILGAVRPSKCKLVLTRLSNTKLVIA